MFKHLNSFLYFQLCSNNPIYGLKVSKDVRDLWDPPLNPDIALWSYIHFLSHMHTHTHVFTHRSHSVYNRDRHLEKPNIQFDEGVRCGQSCSAHLQTQITSRCPSTGLGRDWARLFSFHSLRYPSSATRTATMLAVAGFFTNYQLCIIP